MRSVLTTSSTRMSGFIAHLRLNGFVLGPAETADALNFLDHAESPNLAAARLGLKTMLSGERGQWERFDALFDAYWFERGVRRLTPADHARDFENARNNRRPEIWDKILPPLSSPGDETETGGPMGRAEDDDADATGDGTGRLVATERDTLSRKDLRELATKEDAVEAERIAERLARAIRYRLSRRRKPGFRGTALDLRRTIRRNLGHGGEPIELIRRHKPDRPVNIVVLLDISGSMTVYSRYFLMFIRGLVCRWLKADAYLFHTRLMRVSDALRDQDPMRAMTRLAPLAEGFGGGTRIAGSLATFNARYAKEAINGRTVVIVMSDGYDTDPPEALASELKRLKTRARRLVWLNPLLGWRDYAPVARGMAAALPYIDHFAAANTLESLAAIEADLARL